MTGTIPTAPDLTCRMKPNASKTKKKIGKLNSRHTLKTQLPSSKASVILRLISGPRRLSLPRNRILALSQLFSRVT